MTTDRTRPTEFDRLASAWLADGPTELVDRVLDAALEEIHTTHQRRAPSVLWRFPLMSKLSSTARLVIVGAVLLLAVAGALYVSGGGPSNPVATNSPQTPVPTLQPGVPGWTTYTSAVYGFTMKYPSDWSVFEPATEKWPAGRDVPGEQPYAEAFISPTDPQIGLWVWQVPAPAGSDWSSEDGTMLALVLVCESLGEESCEPPFPPRKICVGAQCLPGYLTLIGGKGGEIPHAIFRDPKTGAITVFQIGREDTFPSAAKYGGSHALLTFFVEQWGS